MERLLRSFKNRCANLRLIHYQHPQELRLEIIVAGSLYKMSYSIKQAISLTLRGKLNSKDMEVIRTMNKLQILDLRSINRVKQMIMNSLPQASMDGMKRLRVLVLPELIKTDALAVINCRSLEEVIVPKGLTTLNSGIVYNCRNFNRYIVEEDNMNFSEINGALLNKDGTKLLSVPCGMKGVYHIPDSVIEIVGGAFLGCTHIYQVHSNKIDIKIDNNAFYGCRCSSDIGRNVEIRTF
jgi:hypothetical protein